MRGEIHVNPVFRILSALALLVVAPVGSTLAQAPRESCELFAFWDSDFEGDLLGTKRNQPNLSNLGGWNDQISSINIIAGVWEFFEHADYQGAAIKLGPGAHNLDRTWNDRISSFRCVQPTTPIQ